MAQRVRQEGQQIYRCMQMDWQAEQTLVKGWTWAVKKKLLTNVDDTSPGLRVGNARRIYATQYFT